VTTLQAFLLGVALAMVLISAIYALGVFFTRK
jgi:hypothetical protein